MWAKDSMVHTVLKLLKCRYFISQKIGHFSTKKIPLNFQEFEQNYKCQNERKLSVFRKFKYSTFGWDVLHYIHQENL